MKNFNIAGREIGDGHPSYIIAEVSCNHEGDFDEARRIIEVAAACGTDAAKLQTYTADTISRNFKTKPKGTIWENIDLYKIYEQAHTPWEWHKELKKVADDCGIHLFSSPFDETAVDHLMAVDSPVLKVASFEVVDTKLLEKMAQTGLPIIMSNGMTDFLEMDEAVRTLYKHGTKDLALLHCNSGYPAAFDEANLATIPAMAGLFDCVVGVSDHTIYADPANYVDPMAHVTPFEAVSRFGAKIVEVHLMLDRAKARALMEKEQGGYDWPFSREPEELKLMIDMIRAYEAGEDVEYKTELEKVVALKTHGHVNFQPTEKEMNSRGLRPSLWVVEDIKAGERFTFAGGKPGNIDSIRPAGGLHIRFADFIQDKKALRDIPAGTPLEWDMVAV
ncbi:MAG: N-acetylneuraminate synthase family protein [Rhodospirillales bacterium]|nr:N-acetylneuraminate synthase family protein [Rhodospirillales bacterium]